MALSKAKNFKNFISFLFCDVTARYVLDLVLCFSYTDYKFICYLLSLVICLFVAIIYLFTRNTSTSCEFSSNLVKTVLAFHIFCLLEARFTSRSCISCWIRIGKCWLYCQKHPSIGVHTNRCSVKQLYWNHTSARLLSCKFPAYFQNIFL